MMNLEGMRKNRVLAMRRSASVLCLSEIDSVLPNFCENGNLRIIVLVRRRRSIVSEIKQHDSLS
jgi:hypothetical protein